MKYEDYIKLGFERQELKDSVRFKECGYYGYTLELKLGNKMTISTTDCSLNEPRLYHKGNYLIDISFDQVKSLSKKLKPYKQ